MGEIEDKVAAARARALDSEEVEEEEEEEVIDLPRRRRAPFRRLIAEQNPELADTWHTRVVEVGYKRRAAKAEFQKTLSDAQMAGMSYDLLAGWVGLTRQGVAEAVRRYRKEYGHPTDTTDDDDWDSDVG